MQYTLLGNTGYRVSRLGFGSMRLPMLRIGGEEYVDVERAIGVIHRALELGVNYIDTGFLYCSEESELVVASALAQWPRRDEVVVAAKCTKMRASDSGDLRRMLEHQLWKQRREFFDFYLFHGIGWDNWHEIDERIGWIGDMLRAKDEGLVKHIGFSFHDKPESMIRLVDEGIFELVTCQYNYLDIPRVFELVNYHRVYSLEEYAATEYRALVQSGADASVCVRCDTCLDRCPQNIAIPDQLEEARELFGTVP